MDITYTLCNTSIHFQDSESFPLGLSPPATSNKDSQALPRALLPETKHKQQKKIHHETEP